MEILFAWITLSVIAGVISNSKGRGFAIGFFVAIMLSPVIGIIIAAVLQPNPNAIEAKQIAQGGNRKCPFCAEMIKIDAVVCRFCKKESKPLQAPPLSSIKTTTVSEVERKRLYVIVGGVFVVITAYGLAVAAGLINR